MKSITDSELLKIAENWEKEMPINLGVKTAFAAGYRLAERQVKNCTIPDVSKSACIRGFEAKSHYCFECEKENDCNIT
jgi:hypothetical protein